MDLNAKLIDLWMVSKDLGVVEIRGHYELDKQHYNEIFEKFYQKPKNIMVE